MNITTSLQKIQREVDVFLTTQPGSEDAVRLTLDASNLRSKYPVLATLFPDELSVQAAGKPEKLGFGIFNPEDSARVAELVSLFSELTDRTDGNEGLDLVVKAAEVAATIDGLELAQYALMAFIIHNDEARSIVLPPFWMRYTNLLYRDPNRPIFGAAEGTNESILNWFREDIFLGEHHQHWHLVYGQDGVDGGLNDRHGELFLYMHQQMLARYNTERITAGLSMVEPFPQKNFNELIDEGYAPHISGYSGRDPGKRLIEDGEVNTTRLDSWGNAIHRGIALGVLLNECGDEVPVDEDSLGNAIEGNIRSINKDMYGDLHRRIHTMIAMLSSPYLGVMYKPRTSANDPVFFRWHRYLDDMSFRFQETQEPNTFGCDMPKVLIRSTKPESDNVSQSPDIILGLDNQIERYRRDGESLDVLGERLFGAGQWHMPLAELADIATNELCTHMETVDLDLEDANRPARIHFLNQVHEFTYFIRVQNLLDEEQIVTVRIWLVAKHDCKKRPLYNDRRMWIEMDTFQATLPANAKKVICRPAKLSSVIKKSGGEGRAPTFVENPTDTIESQENSNDYCDCGWPYSLLLPRGTEKGMAFRLLVMFTGNDVDMQGVETQCGSVSLCGLRKKRYPDKQRMGYPFNRRFPDNKSIEEVIQQQGNMAARDIWIKHLLS